MERLNNIKGAIFDLDGTLLDSMFVWEDIDKKFLSKRGLTATKEYMDAINPLGFFDAAVYTIDKFKLKDTPKELINEWHSMAIDAYSNQIKLKPYAKDFLIKLKNKGVKLGVATALDKELFLPALKNNGVLDLFDSKTSLNEVDRGKGYPDIYLKEAKKLSCNPKESAVFEDIYLGLKGANVGGFLTVGIYDKFSDYERKKIINEANIYVKNFKLLL